MTAWTERAGLRAITLHPWWAWAVAHGDKRREFRTRPYPRALEGVAVALHAGRATPGEARGPGSTRLEEAASQGAPVAGWRAAGAPASCVVALVTFGEILETASSSARFAWEITHVWTLCRPVPAAGRQGWWTLDASTWLEVDARLPAGAVLP